MHLALSALGCLLLILVSFCIQLELQLLLNVARLLLMLLFTTKHYEKLCFETLKGRRSMFFAGGAWQCAHLLVEATTQVRHGFAGSACI